MTDCVSKNVLKCTPKKVAFMISYVSDHIIMLTSLICYTYKVQVCSCLGMLMYTLRNDKYYVTY